MLTADSNIIVADEQHSASDALDFSMSKMIGEKLNEKYPGHLWAVRVRGEQGVATIHNFMLSAEYGYLLKLDQSYSASDLLARAVRGAGEILERFKQMRGRVNDDAIAAMPTDIKGRVIGDVSK